ncbi:hypothetical protein KIPB_000301 [Kipferlia bialata]|uniref:Uncharacterized protein n=1 Tax=Kipferlia bialata TaxID=797122 RepID=A0A9K3GEU9_9EUKA|nr:hypothetical protein KIPB_000301 [Kipferlia bialata]|eukprot:g301.t1
MVEAAGKCGGETVNCAAQRERETVVEEGEVVKSTYAQDSGVQETLGELVGNVSLASETMSYVREFICKPDPESDLGTQSRDLFAGLGPLCKDTLALSDTWFSFLLDAVKTLPLSADTLYGILIPLRVVADNLTCESAPLLREMCTLLIKGAETLVQEPYNFDVVARIATTLTLLLFDDGISQPDLSADKRACRQYLIDEGLLFCIRKLLCALMDEIEYEEELDPMSGMDGVEGEVESETDSEGDAESESDSDCECKEEGEECSGEDHSDEDLEDDPSVPLDYRARQDATYALGEMVVLILVAEDLVYSIDHVRDLVGFFVEYSLLTEVIYHQLLAPLTVQDKTCELLFESGILSALTDIAEDDEEHECMLQWLTRRLLTSDTVTDVGDLVTGPKSLPALIYPLLKVKYEEQDISLATQMLGEAMFVLWVLADKVESPEQEVSILRPALEPLCQSFLDCKVTKSVQKGGGVISLLLLRTVLRVQGRAPFSQPEYIPQVHKTVIKILNWKRIQNIQSMCAMVLFNMAGVEETHSPSRMCESATVQSLTTYISQYSDVSGVMFKLPVWRLLALWSANPGNEKPLTKGKVNTMLSFCPFQYPQERLEWYTARVSKYKRAHSLEAIYKCTTNSEGVTGATSDHRGPESVKLILAEIHQLAQILEAFFKWKGAEPKKQESPSEERPETVTSSTDKSSDQSITLIRILYICIAFCVYSYAVWS